MPIIWQWIGHDGTAPVTVTVSTPLWSPLTNSATTSSGGYDLWQTSPATAATTANVYQTQAQMAQQNAQAFSLTRLSQAHQRAYERYSAFVSPHNQEEIARAAILTHQEEARRDEAAYARALCEHNDQEAARIRRIIEAREQSDLARRQAIDAQAQRVREAQLRRQTAGDRARALLLEHLTPAQRDSFTALGWFIVEGGRSGTKYRIHAKGGVAGNIEALNKQGAITHRLCCHARDSAIPAGDHHLSQKIMLELAEDDFLRLANRHAVR